MNGNAVGVSRTASTSPRVKHNVTSIMKPKTPFTATELIMALGSVSDASLISSAANFDQFC